MDRSVPDVRNVDRLVWEACKANDRSLLRSLLANGGQPDWYPSKEDPSARSCLYMTAERGDLAMMKDLIKHGADVNKVGGPIDRTPFHVAAATNNMKLAELLIELGADVNKLDQFGESALHMASSCNYMLMVKLLIKSGADTDLPDATGWTPMHIAARRNFLEIVWLLIKSGARKDMSNMWGLTPLHVAVEHGHGEIVAELLKAGATKTSDSRNRRGETPLATAVRLGHSRIVLLLTNGADTNDFWSNVSVEDFRQILDIRSANKTAEMSGAIGTGLVLVLLGAYTTFVLTGGPQRLGNVHDFLQRFRSK